MHSRSSVVAYRSSARCLTRGFELRRTSRLRCRGASPSTNPESDGKPRVDVNSDGTSKGEQPQPSKPSKVPVDTPLRQANREVAYGVLTVRAVATLIVYLQETNLHLAGWLVTFIRRNPINLAGSAEEASGAAFIKKMLAEPIQPALWDNGVDPMHATTNGCHVDPRSMAQRILAIRAQLATEVRQDMKSILEDNEEVLRRLQRSALESSFKLKTAITAAESN